MFGYTNHLITHRGVLEEGTAFIQKPFTGPLLWVRLAPPRLLLQGG